MKNIYRILFKQANTILIVTVFVLCNSRCEDFVQVDPPKNKLVSATVFESEATAEAAVMGMYSKLIDFNADFANGGVGGITLIFGTYADELTYNYSSPVYLDYYHNTVPTINSFLQSNWNTVYNVIYQANSILEGLHDSSPNVSKSKADQLRGEALFVRAFCLFYAVNMWGDVPLVLTTDYRINSKISRTAASEVYAQIESDLEIAKGLLPGDYAFTGGERVRVNKFGATAFLARVYLYQEKWDLAESEASAVISHPSYDLETDLNDVFKSTSHEAIWQLVPTTSNGTNFTNEGRQLVPFPGTRVQNYSLTQGLYNAFEVSDQRKNSWTVVTPDLPTYAWAFKYKILVRTLYNPPFLEYSMVLRLAEQYLIRAEARMRLGNTTDAQSDLNVVRNRAGLNDTSAASETELFTALVQERRVELFAEWGHRFFDLKRWRIADEVLGVTKAPNWQAHDNLLPIPATELSKNSNLIQNDGY